MAENNFQPSAPQAPQQDFIVQPAGPEVTDPQGFKNSKTLGIVGTVFGALGLFLLPLVFGIVALVCGILTKYHKGLRIASIVLGAVDIVFWLVALFVVGALAK